MDCIESAIHNLIIYTEKMIKSAKTIVELDGLLSELETCLVLTMYITLSERMVEEICRFIFKYNLGNISIDQKIFFLYYQVFCRHITNASIQKILEDTLIKYLDERLISINEGKQWDSFSKTSGINYPNIADYIDIGKKGIISLRLSKRVSVIVDRKIIPMQKEIVEHYLKHISKRQRKRLSKWIEDMLIENFEFDKFVLLMQVNARRAKTLSDKLFLYLECTENEVKSETKNGIACYPRVEPHVELLDVGYWCMCGLLDSKKFIPFKGITPEYDFLIDTMNFDYSQFDVGWLLRMPKRALNIVAKKTSVRNKILKIVLQEIKNDELKQDDQESLIKILGEHFAN